MSSILRTENRVWLPLAIGLAALLTALIGLGIVRKISDRPVPSTGQQAPPAVIGEDGEPLPQAKWEVSVFPTSLGKPSKAQKTLVGKQREQLKTLVASLSDALILQGGVSEVKQMLTTGVARRLNRSRLTLPEGMGEVRTVRRSARIGVDEKATHAAARVTVAYLGSLKQREVKVQQKMDLWLERGPKGWRVVAFSGTAEQAR